MWNSLVDIYDLTPGVKGDSFGKFDSESELPIEFAAQVLMYSARIFFTESIGRHDAQDSMARLFLHELELRVLSAGLKKKLNLSGVAMDLRVSDISSSEHVPVIPGHPSLRV